MIRRTVTVLPTTWVTARVCVLRWRALKDSSGDEYHWDRDAAQRKILLKIPK